jgi:hypothetical protein
MSLGSRSSRKKTGHTPTIKTAIQVFRPLDIFPILLHYTLILKWIQLFYSPSSINTQYLTMTLQKQVFRHFSKCIKYFQVCPEMFDRVQVRALAGPLNDIQRFVPKPLLHCLDCVAKVFVLVEGEPSPQSIHLSLDPD